MKVLVVDATHGGVTLSEEFSLRGDDVTCVDVHRTLKKGDFSRLSSLFELMRDLPDPSDYDLIVRPVHFPMAPFSGHEGRVITHHQAVRILARDLANFPIAEVTGSFGKTTAVMCAISLLRDQFSVLSLTSKGICLDDHEGRKTLLEGVSAAPANIIRAIRLSPVKPDLAIFEVSLGGTGLADLGIIKNVYDDYPIAKGTSSASKAKLSMLSDSRPGSNVLVNADDPKLGNLAGVQRFSPSGMDCEIKAMRVKISKNGIEFNAVFEGFKAKRGNFSGEIRVRTSPGPIGRQHVENLLVGAAMASFFRPVDDVLLIDGAIFDKMVLKSAEPPVVINRSASIGAKSIDASIRDYLELFPPARLELGGKLKTTCGSSDLNATAQIIRSSPFQEIALFGEFGEALAPLLAGKATVRDPFEGGPKLVLERG